MIKISSATSSWWAERNKIMASLKSKPAKAKTKKVKAQKSVKVKKAGKAKKIKTRKATKVKKARATKSASVKKASKAKRLKKI